MADTQHYSLRSVTVSTRVSATNSSEMPTGLTGQGSEASPVNPDLDSVGVVTVKYVENPPQHVPRPVIVPCVVTQPQLATAEPSETSLSLAVSQVRSSTFAANQQQTPRFSLHGSTPAAAVNERFTTLYINSSNTNS